MLVGPHGVGLRVAAVHRRLGEAVDRGSGPRPAAPASSVVAASQLLRGVHGVDEAVALGLFGGQRRRQQCPLHRLADTHELLQQAGAGGDAPLRVKGIDRVASAAMSRRSQPSARLKPAPWACPLTMAITGLDSCRIRSTTSGQRPSPRTYCSMGSGRSRGPGSPTPAIPRRSSPAQNARPGAGQHHGPHVRVGVDVVERGQQVQAQAQVEGVQPLGSVEHQPGDRTLAANVERPRPRVGHRPTPTCAVRAAPRGRRAAWTPPPCPGTPGCRTRRPSPPRRRSSVCRRPRATP